MGYELGKPTGWLMVVNEISGWWFQTWLAFMFHFINMGCHPKPIDELHHFSRWLK
jgi:hypothetical protein